MTEPRPVLFGSARSPHCFEVSLVLHETGVDFERVEIDLPARERKTPAFLALNPLGQVPVDQDEVDVHVDSLVIMRHLDRRHPEPSLFPSDGAEDRRANHTCASAAASVSAAALHERRSWRSRPSASSVSRSSRVSIEASSGLVRRAHRKRALTCRSTAPPG